MSEPLLYKIALSMIPGIGGVLARNLVAYVGSVEGIFRESANKLTKIPGIGEVNARRIKETNILSQASAEIEFAQKHDIEIFFYLDESYPVRFRQCADGPIVFYKKGRVNLDNQKIISIVGTRNASEYGKQLCDELLRDLAAKGHQLLVASGLAYGIDIQAHKSALKYNLSTIGILGHGLDKLYPSAHVKTAKAMIENGGLLTDFPSNTKIDPSNFIRRNRLIAGIADATIVIESGEKGGALITADIASSYDREVFAFPGRATDPYSKGCNRLIKNNLAALIENATDLEFQMGWEISSTKKQPFQHQLFIDLTNEETTILNILKREEKSFIDIICQESGMPMSKVSAILLNLEFKGAVDALPGKMYRAK
jgi:DNA processing protein